MLQAGVSLVDISPEKGIQLAGYPHCPRPNKGIHDPLYASSLILDNGEKKIAIVTMDLLYIGKKYVAEIRSRFDFPILFTATHTHSGPWSTTALASEREEGIHDDPGYTAFLVEKLTEGIRLAEKEMFSAVFGTYVGRCGAECGVGGNRRVKGGLCDPSLNILAVKDESGDFRAILLNYALHPTYLHAESEVVSADYPGYFRRFMHFAQPKAITMFAQGTSGNQSSRYHRVAQDFEEACRVGTTLGYAVNACLEKMTFTDKLSLTVKSQEIELPIREYPPLDKAERAMEAARARFASMKGSDYISMRNAELDMFGAENIYYYAKQTAEGITGDEELPCELQTVLLNDTLIVALQGEMFVEYGLAIKEASPYAKTFVFEVSNGSLPGYIYTPEAGEEGGYEVGTSMFAANAGEALVEKVKEMF